MDIRYNINPETGQPHILDHGITEDEVEEVLESAPEDFASRNRTRTVTGPTLAGRIIRVVYAYERMRGSEEERLIVTAYELRGTALAAYRRRRRRRYR